MVNWDIHWNRGTFFRSPDIPDNDSILIGIRYKFYETLRTWEAARAHCQEQGMILANVNSKEVADKIAEITGGSNYWFDLSRHSGSWKTSSGEDNHYKFDNLYSFVTLSLRPT